jgi:hypothetical protein
MKERPLVFGAHEHLYGVLCEPDAGHDRAGAPTVLFANIGIHHHVGPNRIWVELARLLAARGVATLRFDLSGLGESDARPGREGDAERHVLDFQDAMEAVARRRGASGFTLVGLCSGVDAVHATALVDPRVRGVVYIDGYAWPTRLWGTFQLLRLLHPLRWRRRLRRWLRDDGPMRLGAGAEIYVREVPSPERFRADVAALVARGTRILALYSSGVRKYSYRGQFKDMMRGIELRGLVEADLHGEADHLFTRLDTRARLLERIASWIDAQRSGAEVSPAERKTA